MWNLLCEALAGRQCFLHVHLMDAIHAFSESENNFSAVDENILPSDGQQTSSSESTLEGSNNETLQTCRVNPGLHPGECFEHYHTVLKYH